MAAKQSWIIALLVTTTILLLTACGTGTEKSVAPAPIPRETAIVIGVTVPNPEEDQQVLERFQPLIDYLAAPLGRFGIQQGQVLIARSPVEMAKFMRQAKVDLYVDSAFASIVVNQLSGAELFLSRWKKGVEKYHSTIFVRRGEGIDSLDDLKGKMIAFEDPGSTSAYFLPKAELLGRDYKLTEKQGPSDQVTSEEIGYYFSMSDKQVVIDVMTGVAAAGGQQEAEVTDYLEGSGQAEDAALVLLTTSDIYRHVVTVRSGLDPRLKEGLKELMLAMDESAEGGLILQTLSKTTKFGEFEPNPQAAFDEIRDLASLIEKEIVQR